MLSWVVTFLVVALIAGILGFGGIAGASIEIAKAIFFIAIVLFLVSAVVGLVRGRTQRLTPITRYFEGIATFRPMPSGRGTAACESTTAWMRARMSGGNGATFRAFMSMWSVMFSEVAESQPSVAWRNSSNVCSRFSS